MKLLLVAEVNPVVDALSCLGPTRVPDTESNVARPRVFVARVVRPVRVPVPVLSVRVIDTPDRERFLFDLSLSWIVIGGETREPATVFVGC